MNLNNVKTSIFGMRIILALNSNGPSTMKATIYIRKAPGPF